MVDNFKQSLPPKVVGPIHGYLDLKVDQVIWTRRTNCAVKIKVHWWGQDNSEFQFRLGNKHEKTLYTYTIQTTFKLFRNYLMNCLGLTLSVIDEQMGTLIGVCVLKNLHLIIVDETPHEGLYPILNEYDSQIGSLRVGFRLCILSNSESKMSSKSCDSLPHGQHLKVNSLNSPFISSDSDNVSSKIVHKVLKQGQRLRNAMVETILDNDPFNKDVYHPAIVPKLDSQMSTARNQSEFDKNIRVFDYLTGANVSPFEEEQILNTIRTISPATSMIKLASDLHFQNTNEIQREKPIGVINLPSQQQSSKICNDYSEKLKSISQKSILNNNENKTNLLSFVDSFKIYVYTLKFNSAGWRKVIGSDNKSVLNRAPTFFIEYVLPQLLNGDALKHTEKKTKVNSNIANRVTRFCSKKVVHEVIHFKQQSIHKIVNIESLNLNNFILELKIFSRNVSQRGAIPIGIAKCNLSDIIDQDNFTCDEELIVVDTNKPLGIGTLKIRLQFGCDKIHFGKEFIEAITCEKENRKLSNCDSITKDLNSEDNTCFDSKKKSNLNVNSILPKPMTTSLKNKSLTVPSKDKLRKNINSILNEYELITNFDNNTSMLNLLQCLIYIPEIHFDTINSKCTFLICRAFWREDTTISKLYYHTQRAVYQFREIIPLLYNSEFLSRSKNNYLIIEIWENDGNTENFLGICKLPLHQLYVAYRDPKVACHLVDAKLPVIAFDGWEEIIHPISFNHAGQLQALLAVGTESQIHFLEISRGINEPSVGKLKNYNEFNFKHLAKQSNPNKNDVDNLTNDIQKITNIAETNRNFGNSLEIEVANTQTNQNIERTLKLEEQIQPRTVEESATQTTDLTQVIEKQDKAIQTYINQSTQTDFIVSVMESKKQKSSGGKFLAPNCLESSTELVNKLSSSNQQVFNQSPQVNINLENKRKEIDNPKLEDTSKLFEMLQQALSQPQQTTENNTFRAHIVIENAVHLSTRRRRIKSKGKHAKKYIEIMPTTYVTFESIPEKGLLYTSIVPKCTNPRWNKHFECHIPRDMLYDDQKRLIFKVWNKNGTDYTEPNIVTDSVIGFAALDLTVLSAGLPSIQGWFNIMDFTSRCNGQIKINVTPLEDILKKSTSMVSSINIPNIPLLSIPTSSPSGGDLFELTSSTSLLSNTLKRKFTELDEITERLKQRLMDVTKNDEDSDNNNEFEHDLNTEPPINEEMDDFDFTNIDLKSNNCPPNTGVSAISVADSGFMESKDLEKTSMDMNDIDKKMKENKLNFDALFEKLSLHINDSNAQNKILDNISEESTESTSTDLLRNRHNNQNEDLTASVSSITLSSVDRNLVGSKLYDQYSMKNSESDLSSFDLNSETILLNREAPEGAGNVSTENLNQIIKKKK